jgi:hypothetical protein
MRLLGQIGLLLLAAICFWLSAINAIRFAIEFDVSPTRYLLQDALLAFAGALGVLLCWLKSNNLGSRAIANLIPPVSPAEKAARARRFNIAALVLLVAYAFLRFARTN